MNLKYLKLHIKSWIASNILDRFDLCWCDLVMWTLGNYKLSEVNRMICCEGQEYNYCGKCDSNMKFLKFPWNLF